MPAPILLCTVGTSLFSNIKGLIPQLASGALLDGDPARPLAEAYSAKDWGRVARELLKRSGDERICGAEVNSLHSLIKSGQAPVNCGLYFFHSDTDDGRAIATVLVELFRGRGHSPVEAVPIADLQDQEPKRFRTHGLRNLVRELCHVVRQYSPASCAFNATGGYKAQIAIAVLVGQALGIPVYYMFEGFSEIISFPPMPVALDFEVWMGASGLLFDLARSKDAIPAGEYRDEIDERMESLVTRVEIDGAEYLELSPSGQIFHETFRERFRTARDQVLPPPAVKKLPPALHDHGVINANRNTLVRYLERVTAEVPCVARCATNYCHPDLPSRERFRLTRGEVEGVWSDGSVTVKYLVETTATTEGQKAAAVAALNQWLETK